jgi:acetyl-CoA C-acetyltransferase
MSRPVYLVGHSRTPIGKFAGGLGKTPVDELIQHVVKSVIRKAGVIAGYIDGGFCGHAFQSRYTPNTGRFAWLKAELPANVPWATTEVECGSGMHAANLAMDAVRLHQGEIYLAVGAESMSTVPYLVPSHIRFKWPMSRWFSRGPRPFFGLVDDSFWPRSLSFDLKTTYMAGVAQRLANTYNISRTEADEYSLRSQELAARAIKSGRFAQEIDPVLTKRGIVMHDEHPRSTSIDKLAKLPGVLKTQDITAGNSSGINDGACALLIASGTKAQQLGLEPIVELVDHVLVGCDPTEMGIGPVLAVSKLLRRNNLGIQDIDIFELNEAFASQYLACEKLLKLPRERTNVNGGAIALGHPIGMSGARIIETLAVQMKIQGAKLGIGCLCIGGGMGIATLVKAVS